MIRRHCERSEAIPSACHCERSETIPESVCHRQAIDCFVAPLVATTAAVNIACRLCRWIAHAIHRNTLFDLIETNGARRESRRHPRLPLMDLSAFSAPSWIVCVFPAFRTSRVNHFANASATVDKTTPARPGHESPITAAFDSGGAGSVGVA